jgi:hypothetical protein
VQPVCFTGTSRSTFYCRRRRFNSTGKNLHVLAWTLLLPCAKPALLPPCKLHLLASLSVVVPLHLQAQVGWLICWWASPQGPA